MVGKVLYTTEFSALGMDGNGLSEASISANIQNDIDMVLSIMPRCASHISTEKLVVDYFGIPYLLTFEHPLFEDGTKLEFDYVRDCYAADNKIIQFSVISDFRYIKPDGTPRYKRN